VCLGCLSGGSAIDPPRLDSEEKLDLHRNCRALVLHSDTAHFLRLVLAFEDNIHISALLGGTLQLQLLGTKLYEERI